MRVRHNGALGAGIVLATVLLALLVAANASERGGGPRYAAAVLQEPPGMLESPSLFLILTDGKTGEIKIIWAAGVPKGPATGSQPSGPTHTWRFHTVMKTSYGDL